MRIVIVDDEPLARERLRGQLQELGVGELVGEASNGLDAIRTVQDRGADVVLLDVRMPGMDGIETARHLRSLEPPPSIIFATAFDEHALAAFEASAIDYLLKPIRVNRLREALSKAQLLSAAQLAGLKDAAETRVNRSHVSGYLKGNLTLIPVDRILYFHADQGYVNVVWEEGAVLIEESLRTLEDEFAESFVRIHRNALVALRAIAELTREPDGTHVIVLRDVDERLAVSRRLLSQVRRRLR